MTVQPTLIYGRGSENIISYGGILPAYEVILEWMYSLGYRLIVYEKDS
jgi:hypothetical protein